MYSAEVVRGQYPVISNKISARLQLCLFLFSWLLAQDTLLGESLKIHTHTCELIVEDFNKKMKGSNRIYADIFFSMY